MSAYQQPSDPTKKRKYTPHKPIAPALDADALMSITQVAAHFGRKSKMFVERWLRRVDLNFPRPVVIGGQRYWRRGDILDFVERQKEWSCNPPSHDNGAQSAANAPAAQSPADARRGLPIAAFFSLRLLSSQDHS